jgi:hypothetical protein
MLSKVNYTKEYLECLVFGYNNGFIGLLHRIKSSKSLREETLFKLVLLHPAIYLPVVSKKTAATPTEIQELIQGKRAFSSSFHETICSSKELWGYDCPLFSEPLVLDHDFPYSLGGATDSAMNKRVLCRWHNMLKGNDIHVYDWKKLFEDVTYYKQIGREHWIDKQFTQILYQANL